MSIRYIDRAATEAAIRAANEYASFLEDLAESLKAQAQQIGQDWEGQSFNLFWDDILKLVARISDSSDLSRAAAYELRVSLERAQRDEADAARKAMLMQ